MIGFLGFQEDCRAVRAIKSFGLSNVYTQTHTHIHAHMHTHQIRQIWYDSLIHTNTHTHTHTKFGRYSVTCAFAIPVCVSQRDVYLSKKDPY